MKSVRVVAAAIIDGDDVLIVRRGPGQSGAGEWEFPGGKVEVGESDELALKREILEELAVNIHVLDYIGSNQHAFPTKVIDLQLYRCQLDGFVRGQIVLIEHDDQKWVPICDLKDDQLAFADRPFVSLIQKI